MESSSDLHSSDLSSADMWPASASSLSTISRPPTPTDGDAAYTIETPFSSRAQIHRYGCYSLDMWLNNVPGDPVNALLCRNWCPNTLHVLRIQIWAVCLLLRLAALDRQQIELGGIGTVFEAERDCIAVPANYPKAFTARELWSL